MRQIIEAAVAPLSASASIAGGAAGSAAQPATALRLVLRGATPRVNGQRFERGSRKQKTMSPYGAIVTSFRL